MDTYQAVKERLERLLYEKRFSVYKLSLESSVSPSTIKNILYGKSKNPGIVTLKMLCDGLGLTLAEFFDTEEFRTLDSEQEKFRVPMRGIFLCRAPRNPPLSKIIPIFVAIPARMWYITIKKARYGRKFRQLQTERARGVLGGRTACGK